MRHNRGRAVQRRCRQPEFLDRGLHLRCGRVIGDDKRAGGELDAVGRERLLCNTHRHVPQLVAERNHVVRAEVRDRDSGRSRARKFATQLRSRDECRPRLEDRRICALDDIDVERVPHRPTAIVVRLQTRVGILLLLDEIFREPTIRLIALDNV